MRTISRSFLSTIVFALIITTGVFAAGSLGGGQFDFSYSGAPLFGPYISDNTEVLFQGDGKILSFGGYAPNLNGRKLFRYLPNGLPDPAFSPYYPNAAVDIEHIALQSDGRLIYSYLYNDAENYSIVGLVRLNTNGSRDTTFNFTFLTEGPVFEIAPVENGQIVLAGRFRERQPFNPPVRFMLRLNPDGSRDTSFGANGSGTSIDVELQPDNKIIYVKDGLIQRLDSSGNIDSGYSTALTNVTKIKIAANAELYANNGSLFRLNEDGTTDPTFDSSNAQTPVNGFTLFPDGKPLIFSNRFNSTTFRNFTDFQLLNLDGTSSHQFSNRFLTTYSIHSNPEGELYVRGSATIDGKTIGIARMRLTYVPSNQKAADFDGDGKSDLAVFRPSTGVWYIYSSATGSYSVTQFGLQGDKPVPADYDGDRIADIAVYRPSTGVWYRLNSSDGSFHAVRFGLAEDIPTPNDYDADGRDDISVFRPSDGNWYRLNSADDSFASFHFGSFGDKPAAGDYDGDAITDFAVWRPSESIWYRTSSLNNSFGSTMISYFDDDITAPMDVDGDGRIDISYWKGFSQAWRGVYSSNNSGFYFPWGLSGDIPVPGDFDGDGRDDIAIWRPSTGVWWIGNSSTGAVTPVQFGTNGDIPAQSGRNG